MEKVFSMDSFWLIFWGLIASASAWAFWYYTGVHGFQIITAEVRDWFFNKGIDAGVAGEKLALISITAEKDNLPEISVHRRLAKG